MRKYTYTIIVAIIMSCASLYAQGEYNFGLKYYGLSIHPGGDKQAHLMPYKLDPKGVATISWGGIASFQKFIFRNLISIKLAQGVYTDSGGVLAGHTHLGFRLELLQAGKHQLNFGFGPTLIYRKNWYTVKEGYQSTGLFKESEDKQIQYKFVWYGGEIEYNYAINEHWDISAHILPGYPILVAFGVGLRYWPERDLLDF